jgi:choline dehydrogenase
MRYDGQAAFDGHGFQVHIGHNKPLSRGAVKVTSADPKAHPSIRFNYLEQEVDKEGFRDCVKLTREIINQPAFDEYRDGEIQPGEQVQTDEEIDAFVRANVESAYHPSCSCKMGTDDLAVVDPQTRVHGIGNLRVVDSSIFPTITNGNLNAPTIMVAERAADLIKSNSTLPASNAAVSMEKNWKQVQRSKF